MFWIGSVLASEKRAWIEELFVTSAPLSTTNITFDIIVKDNGVRCNPIIYFRHENQAGYGTERNTCFNTSVHQFVRPFDRRLLHRDYNDDRCNTVGDQWRCSGFLYITNGYPVHRTATVGFRCEENCVDQYVELISYNIAITEITQVPCIEFDPNIIPGDFQNVRDVVMRCRSFYTSYIPLNLFGHDVNLMNLLFTAVPDLDTSGCYQHLPELTCRSMFPECYNESLVFYPCRDMCDEAQVACSGNINQVCIILSHKKYRHTGV